MDGSGGDGKACFSGNALLLFLRWRYPASITEVQRKFLLLGKGIISGDRHMSAVHP
jgi:hypothetical protein